MAGFVLQPGHIVFCWDVFKEVDLIGSLSERTVPKSSALIPFSLSGEVKPFALATESPIG